jgi:SAM-dependent methyltransferase
MRDLTPCCICGSRESGVVFAATHSPSLSAESVPDPYTAHYRINRCRGCDLQYSSPILDDDGVRALYEHGVVTRTDDSDGTNVAAGEAVGVRRTMQLYYDRIRPFLRSRDSFLEVGCDVGYLLEAAQDDGFARVYGCEPNPLARERAARLRDSEISDRFYEQWELPVNTFDALTLIHVVDHLVDPMRVLEKARGELKPGGVLFAVVHDVECPLARITGERFPPFNLYHHYFFSKTTLRKLLEAAGFEVLEVHNTLNSYSLGFFLIKAPGFPGKKSVAKLLDKTGLARRSVTVPIGNIGIVARKPGV